ncbi:related to peptidylprolyl isomerase (FK506-binding protein homolog) [Rhynchosporium agropyri]|uniref:peptidylprolyl isomerase n=1 Tax=Rhynchosporium agropyri TaxID=914238 RepID=A0A1E1JSD2_9HELO|nr:related to peptidylprolyl isomerase (FK506-binding protein homolog) [Rhynchosporium agropyri]
MGVTKTITKEGDGAIPQKGDRVTIEYTGYLKDTSKPDKKGAKYVYFSIGIVNAYWTFVIVSLGLGASGMEFDSSIGRGAFVTEIGIGRVIKGWDEGVTTMKVGEKATLDITSDFAYGDRGFPGSIPAKADLLFDVELQKIN